MRKEKSQSENILIHLFRHGSITPIEALNLYGCFRLGARIFDLKKMGINIETEIIQKGKKQFANYKYISGGLK